jgi:hypothetical protein
MTHENKPNIVLVHGAWADGSSWSAVIEKLQVGMAGEDCRSVPEIQNVACKDTT